MKRFKNILVYVSNSEFDKPLVAKAVNLAKNNDAKLTVIGVIEESPRGLSAIFIKKLDINVQQLLHEQKQTLLAELLDCHDDKKIAISRNVLTGPPFTTLCTEVICKKHDLLMISDNTGKDEHPTLFGSLTMHLLRKCPCPVWVFKSQPKPDFQRILIAIDIDAETNAEQSINRSLLGLGMSIADFDNAELHVLYCWSIYGESLLRSPRSGLKYEVVEEIIDEAQRDAEIQFDSFLKEHDLDLPASHRHLLKGDVGSNLARVAQLNKIDLVIMGTLARVGIKGYLIGNAAEKIINNIRCSLLAIKPDDFVSPIQA